VAIRTSGAPELLIPTVRQVINTLEPGQLVTRLVSLDVLVNASVAPRRFNFWLLGAFAFVALALAIVGVYGVVAYVVSQRVREIGIRVALGATRRQVVGLLLLSGMRWAVAGTALGLGVAVLVSRSIASMLFGVAPTDPPTFMAIALLMLAISAGASYLPARRAAAADALESRRAD
jgi:putative ABC transport system permease protein